LKVEDVIKTQPFLRQQMFPFAEEIVSSVPFHFTLNSSASKFRQMTDKHSLVILRDGLLPASWAIQQCDLRQRRHLSVSHLLLPSLQRLRLLPGSTHKTVTDWKPAQRRQIQDLIVSSLIHPDFVDAESIAKILKNLNAVVPLKRLRRVTLISAFPQHIFRSYGDAEFNWTCLRNVFKELGLKVEFVAAGFFRSVDVKPGETMYVELNHQKILSESFLQHYFLSKGAVLLEDLSKKPAMRGKWIRVSNFHQLCVKPTKIRAPAHHLKYDSAEALRKVANGTSPWPIWFEAQVRAAFTL